MRSSYKSFAAWTFFVIVLAILFQMYDAQRQNFIKNFNYSKFVTALEAGEIKNVTFKGNGSEMGEIHGEIKPEAKTKYNGATKFHIVGNTGKDGFNIVKQHGITPNYEKAESGFFATQLLTWLPLLLIIVLFMFFFKQLQSGGGKAMSFGKSRARLLTENKNKVTFKDVAGVEEAKEDLSEIIHFLKDPKKFTRLGGRIPKGVLLVGPPGTGKTLLARAVAGEADVPFFTISGSDFVEMFVGVGASRVRDLFEQGKKHAPCLIFIDEIDAVGRHRGAGMGGGHDEREQTLNQLLVEMDGFESNDGVILIAATNRPDVLDPALLRPGRFDRRVIVNNPDLGGREKILNVHVKKVPLASNVDLDKVARGTPGFSGADLENLVNEAALFAARNDKHKVEMADFELAKDKVMMGAERRSMVISEDEKKNTAYHEAGHTLVGKVLPGLDPIHKVSIIPRGMALGVTVSLPKEDAVSLRRSKAKNTIAMLYGGRAAEEIIFEDYTTGAGNDIEKATELARRMVCEWGMSENIGPISLDKREGPVFLGMQNSSRSELSDKLAEEIDTEVKGLITWGHEEAKKILRDNIDVLHTLAKALLEYETIDGTEVDMICKGATLEEVDTYRNKNQKEMDEEQKQAAEAAKIEEKKQAEAEAEKDEAENDPMGSDPVTV